MLDRLKQLLEPLRPGRHDPQLDHLVDRVVNQVERRLKVMGGYPARFRPIVGRARDYAHSLAPQVPGPLPVMRADYARNPLVHALFPSADTIEEAIATSQALQQSLHSGAMERSETIYALLGTRRYEKQTFGMALVGETLQRDVAQTLVYFKDHTLSVPAISETTAREALANHFVDSLFLRIADDIRNDVAQRQRLEVTRAALLSQQRRCTETERETVRQRLAQIEAELSTLLDRLRLDHYPAYMEAILEAPEDYLRLEPVVIEVDGLGIKRSSNDRLAGQFNLVEMIARDRRRWTVTLVALPRDEVERLIRKQREKRWILI